MGTWRRVSYIFNSMMNGQDWFTGTFSFVFGWKDQYGSPEGLFDAANATEEQNIIYVCLS